MVVEIVIVGAFALLTVGAIVRENRAKRANPDATRTTDRAAPGWGGAGAAD